MRFALNDDLPCTDRPDPLTAPYCQWRGNAGIYPRYERKKRYQRVAIEPTGDMNIMVTGDLPGPNQETQLKSP